jgi:mannose-6-phosphate isomerase-like protein (cupin superfamily)
MDGLIAANLSTQGENEDETEWSCYPIRSRPHMGEVGRQIGRAQAAERRDGRECNDVRGNRAFRYHNRIHLHHNSDEIAYVLSGEITFKIGNQVTVGGPGTCAFMPRGTPHPWKSTGAETGRILFSYTPAQAGKWFEELLLSERSLDNMDDQEQAEIQRRHGWERIGPSAF